MAVRINHQSGVCVRVKGGLGNQLFIYAAGRRLAHKNGLALWLDTESGYKQDNFGRKSVLNGFRIAAQQAPRGSFYVSASRLRRLLIRRLNRKIPIAWRTYVEQCSNEFIPEILSLSVRRNLYLDGYWQSDLYFADVANTVRTELTVVQPTDSDNEHWLRKITSSEAVAVHCRRQQISQTLSEKYYSDALRIIQTRVHNPEFFVFSDDSDWARSNLRLPGPTSYIEHNRGAGGELADFRLMCACRHFIIANSSFSWWGAWLGTADGKQVIAPEPFNHWGAGRMLPSSWTLIPFTRDKT